VLLLQYSWYEGRELILAKKSEWYYQQNEALLSVQQAQVELINKLLAAASREGLLRLLAEELRQQRGVMSSVVAAVVEEVRLTCLQCHDVYKRDSMYGTGCAIPNMCHDGECLP
jgi:hypothetical protein